MSPPVRTPIPRFIADSTREGLPYGRWAQQLRDKFASACEPLSEEAKASGLQEVVWFPERTWGGRLYVPATARAESIEGGQPVEYFGFVSHARGDGGEPTDLQAKADFTDIVAEQNPDWKIDLNEEVIGPWRGEAQREGEVTLVWGTPMVPNSFAVTAELDREVVDQGRVSDDRFTLVAVDAVKGFGDDLYLEVRLWDKRGNELAAESLYDEPESESAPDSSAG